MSLYEVPLSMSLLGFGVRTMLANLHMCGIVLVLRAVSHMLVGNTSPRGPMCFRCLKFNLSGPCGLLFLLCCIASWTWVVVSVMSYPCIFCVALFVYMFVLCVWQCLWIVWWKSTPAFRRVPNCHRHFSTSTLLIFRDRQSQSSGSAMLMT